MLWNNRQGEQKTALAASNVAESESYEISLRISSREGGRALSLWVNGLEAMKARAVSYDFPRAYPVWQLKAGGKGGDQTVSFQFIQIGK